MAATRQQFGQHFLSDKYAISKIIDLISVRPDDHIVEIGPGRGALTRPLLDCIGDDGTLDLIEIDPRLIAHLRDTLGERANLRIHHADAMQFDFNNLRHPPRSGQHLRIVGNLPYNIGSPLLLKLLTEQNTAEPNTQTPADLHVMLQLEVARRLTAAPGDPDYSGLTVLTGCFARCLLLIELDADAFTPPPQVRSAFLRITPCEPLIDRRQWSYLKEIVAMAFAQRRKKIRHAFGRYIPATQLEEMGIDTGQRPQTLSVETFARLARHTCAKRQNDNTKPSD